MPYGLPRKIRIAFILQAALASLVLVLAASLVMVVVKHSLVRRTLADEAAYFWRQRAASAALLPPDTRTVRGHLLADGQPETMLPAPLRGLQPGFHELKAADQLVYVDRHGGERLYLVLRRTEAQRLALLYGVVPVLLVLLALCGASWLTYRMSKRLVSPVNWLARRVAHWDPRHPDADDLAPEHLPADVQGETRQLADALHALALRVGDHVARERNFTRDASHELRTPLTVIRVATDMAMAVEDMPPRLERSLRRIQHAGRDMEAVIDAFLILAREADVVPQSEHVDVVELVHEEAEIARELLGDKPVRVEVLVQSPLALHAPPRVLRVVLGNLLRNACAYTDAGSVTIDVHADAVVVRDTGIGMSSESRAKAFEPFFRAAEGHPHGSGLGLSIVRRLCDRFGWTVDVDSALGEGTMFTIRFG